METEDWSSSSEGISDSESCFEDTNDEELFYAVGSLPKLHGVPWSTKRINSCAVSQECTPENGDPVQNECEEESINGMLENLYTKELGLIFDVYLPNHKFRKSTFWNPSFLICLTRGSSPSKAAVEDLERLHKGIPGASYEDAGALRTDAAGELYGQGTDDSKWVTASKSGIGIDRRDDIGDDCEWKNKDGREDKHAVKAVVC
ncbi:hypothetical protein Ancab_039012 [Ancistrocladus abbreviatus]